MTVRLGNNLASLTTIRRLGDSARSLEQSFERLSSGQRINRASDDPAGLAVSLGLNAKQRILTRAKLNLGDASSLLTIADSAMAELSAVATRMAELSEQAANGVYGRSQRFNIDREFQTLGKEIQRLAESTAFNGLSLLTGSRAARAGVLRITGDGGGGGVVSDYSADGRFVLHTANGATGSLQVTDLETSEVRIAFDQSEYLITASQILANGDVIASATLTAGGGERQLFHYNYATGEIRQLTQSLSSDDIQQFTVSEDGSTVAFASFTRYGSSGVSLAGTQNLVVLDVDTGQARSDDAGTDIAGYQIRLSTHGSYVALFQAGMAILGAQVGSSSLSLSAPSFNAGTGGIGNVRGMIGVTETGKFFYYDNTDPTGDNPSTLLQMFEYDISVSSVRQRTNFTVATAMLNPVLNLDGSRIYFVSGTNITGENTHAAGQLFEFETDSGTFRQKTNYTSNAISLIGVTNRRISLDGNRILVTTSLGGGDLFDVSASHSSIDFEAGFGSLGNIVANVSAALSAVRGLNAFTLVDSDIAKFALDRMKGNIEDLSSARGTIGAALSRVGSALSLVESQRGEFASAESRIKDVDIANQSAELVRSQILQQIGASVLAQANQQPRVALLLLGG